MADFVFNIAKGRIAEYVNRVDISDPPNAALVAVVVNRDTGPLPSDADMKDFDSLSAMLLHANLDEVTNNPGYARKTLTDALNWDGTGGGTTAPVVDDTNERVDIDVPDITWTSVAAGDTWTDLVICYDPDTTGGTDANIIPLTNHTFLVTPAGSTITAQIAAAGFFRAA